MVRNSLKIHSQKSSLKNMAENWSSSVPSSYAAADSGVLFEQSQCVPVVSAVPGRQTL